MNDSNVIQILKGSTRAQIFIAHDSPYLLYIRDMLKRKLCDYALNPRFNVWELQYRYFTYDKVAGLLTVPVNALSMVTDELDGLRAPYKIDDETLIEGRPIETKMMKGFVPREAQVPVIDYMAADTPMRKGISTATGSGKTISSIATIVKRGKCAMVVVSGLTEQWVRQCQAFTDIKDRVVLIQGIQSLMRLMESDDYPDIIVFSLETLRRYVNREDNYKDLPPFEQFIAYYGIDTKIMDEVHMNFWTDTMIDLHSTIKNNIYLTATFIVSNPQTRRIFNMVYPSSMILGAGDRDRYIDCWSYTYRMFIPEQVYMKQRGYSHKHIEKYLYKRPQKLQYFFETILFPLINSHYDLKREKGQRCLIYFETINMVLAAQKWLAKAYKHRKVGIYIGESEDQAYNKFEIIVTTPKKCGVGTDIKNLYAVFNTVSFKAEGLTEQLCGRLRKLPDNTTPEYVEIANSLITTQLYHQAAREQVLQRICRNYNKCIIP